MKGGCELVWWQVWATEAQGHEESTGQPNRARSALAGVTASSQGFSQGAGIDSLTDSGHRLTLSSDPVIPLLFSSPAVSLFHLLLD